MLKMPSLINYLLDCLQIGVAHCGAIGNCLSGLYISWEFDNVFMATDPWKRAFNLGPVNQ
jgi:hypothetical protein